jgi:hypothetical protein
VDAAVQVFLTQSDLPEHGHDGLHVAGLSVVGCTQHRELALGKAKPVDTSREERRHYLKRLCGGTKKDRLRGIAEREQIVSAGVADGDDAAMDVVDECAPMHFDEANVAREVRSLCNL